MRFIVVGFIVSSFLVSCGSNSETKIPATVTINDSVSTQPLYPYPQYIQQQVEYVDTTPLAIEMLVYENGKRIDSGFIDRNKFALLSKNFSEPDLNKDELRPKYEEKSYHDLTIDAVTFSITAKEMDLPVRQADILLDPKTKKVKNIIIKKHITTAEGNEIQNLLWVNNMNFQISKTITKPDGTTVDKITKVIWDRPLQ